MSTTTISPPMSITNLSNAINPNNFVDQRALNNVVGAFLNDVAIILTTNYGVKTTARRAEDESFNLQDFTNTDDFELLITYFTSNYNATINDCKTKQFKIDYDFYYRIEGVKNNKSRLEEFCGVVEQLLCHNSSDNWWEYTYQNKKFRMWLYQINTLKNQDLIYQEIQNRNFYLAKQTYNLQLSYSLI